MASETTLQRFL